MYDSVGVEVVTFFVVSDSSFGGAKLLRAVKARNSIRGQIKIWKHQNRCDYKVRIENKRKLFVCYFLGLFQFILHYPAKFVSFSYYRFKNFHITI